ncbi:MAG: DUF2203 family protein [Candidatus Yanofskybacteria bacterium]|nr:DUF2203 family protein [Candidatus Yanofskybacteria bacterium]
MDLRFKIYDLRFNRPIFVGVFFLFILFIIFYLLPTASSLAAVSDEIANRQKQIEEIQRQIDEYQKQIEQSQSTSKTLEGEIKNLNSKISQLNLEIRSLGLSIKQTTSAIIDAENKISEANGKILKHRGALAQYLKAIYETDQESLTEVLLNNANLSDFFTDIDNIRANQDNLQLVIKDIKALKQDIEERQNDLEEKKTELERSRRLQEIEKRSVDSVKAAQAKLLKDTKGKESKYQELVKKSQKDIDAIRAQIGYLIQNGISAEEAVKYGQLAAIGAGIRPAFLLAELEQESALGANVGKCYIVDATSGSTRRVTNGQIYTKGIHPTRDLALFLSITAELNKDPFQTPISCGQGWGGAMGPAQFIPSTWMGYRETVSRLTGHSLPNPWNIEDAFVAAASKLAKDGADSKTRAGEVAASKRYYCGSATSTRSGCVNYANSVQRLAAEIEKNL